MDLTFSSIENQKNLSKITAISHLHKTMNKREIIHWVLEKKKPPYVPWHISLTQEATECLQAAIGAKTIDDALQNHILWLGSIGEMEALANDRFKDIFGVVWDRSVDKDIGVVEGCLLPEPDCSLYQFPDVNDPRFTADMEKSIQAHPDQFRMFGIGFSLYERAWTLRGMENLMMDFHDEPDFVHELLDAIADFQIGLVRRALKYDIDAVYFGDDWGQQTGLQMGPALWKKFILPRLRRMYAEVKKSGKYVFIHSCGKVDELFDDLVEIGLDCFNPFQPEVMDVSKILPRYRDRLCFHGGLSTQKTLPYGSVADVETETKRLLQLGETGSYIFSPAHAVEGDVSAEKILAFLKVLHSQPGYLNRA